MLAPHLIPIFLYFCRMTAEVENLTATDDAKKEEKQKIEEGSQFVDFIHHDSNWALPFQPQLKFSSKGPGPC